MLRTLESKFRGFAEGLPGAEYIDDCDLTLHQQAAEKADFFLNDRGIICEIKSLENDPAWKGDQFLQKILKRPDSPIVVGRVGLRAFLENFPDPEELTREFSKRLTSSVEGTVKKANRQIRSTKAEFGLQDSRGLLVLLNERVPLFDPSTLQRTLEGVLTKRKKNGTVAFSQVECVLVICSNHHKVIQGQTWGFLIIIENGSVSGSELVADYAEFLTEQWADFLGIPLKPLPMKKGRSSD